MAVALRNRYRRQLLPEELRREVSPKNILMIGPTGVGKTEIARRVAKIVDAPFIKVEATKFTEVGYVGRDVESIVRDLVEIAIGMLHGQRLEQVKDEADQAARQRLADLLAEQLLSQTTARNGRRDRQRATVDERAHRRPRSARRAARAEAAAGAAQRAGAGRGDGRDRDRHAVRGRPVRRRSARSAPDDSARHVPGLSRWLSPPPRRSGASVGAGGAANPGAAGGGPPGRLDAVIETAIRRVEDAAVVFIDEIDKTIAPTASTAARSPARASSATCCRSSKGRW